MSAPRQAIITVDARGLRCPLPVLRLAAAVRSAPACSVFDLLADDSGVAAELGSFVAERGWQLADTRAEADAIRFRIIIESRSQKAC